MQVGCQIREVMPGSASASAEDLRRLLTVYVRSERFGDGTLEAAFESGMLTAIIRRAGILGAGHAAHRG